ncbi:MAG: hypothetical protein GY790_09330 [Bacteroidetes bacterium]|nr:hypothetical protein [Bacteroidota bacterium]
MKRIFGIVISGLIIMSSSAQTEDQEITHYLFPEFTQGVVSMKAGAKDENSLNYNSLTEEMIFENNGLKLAISERDITLIDTVFIKGRKFIPLNDHFVEVIYHSEWDLYVEHKCKAEQQGKPSGYGGTSKTAAISSQSTFMAHGTLYELKLPSNYDVKPYVYLWLKKNGEMNKFINMRELKKLYKDREDIFKAYVKKHRIKYNDRESVIQLIEYLEAN